MLTYRIQYDLSSIGPAINAAVMPLMNQAVRAVAMATAADWREAVTRAKLWGGEKDAYANSIQVKMTGDFSAYVWTDYKNASDIETGRPPRDMKKMLDTSMKVRVNKNGERYLIIPFRHNVPGANATGQAMPPAVYQQASQLLASSIVGQARRMSGTGAWDVKTRLPSTVRMNSYAWGQKLTGPNIPRNMQGMYRFDTSTQGQKRSTFLTFRTMSERSKGWIIPAQPGQFIAQKVADEMRPKAESAFAEAIKRSLT